MHVPLSNNKVQSRVNLHGFKILKLLHTIYVFNELDYVIITLLEGGLDLLCWRNLGLF
jgi:hypothetical protein